MLAKRNHSCLDVTAGRVVKGVHFVNLRDAGDPVELADRYNRQAPTSWCSSTSPPPATTATPWWTSWPALRARSSSRSPSAAASAPSPTPAASSSPGPTGQRQHRGRAPARAAHRVERGIRLQAVVLAIRRQTSRRRRLERLRARRPRRHRHRRRSLGGPGEKLGAGEILLTSMDTDGVQGRLRCRADQRHLARHAHPIIASGGAGAPSTSAACSRGRADAALAAPSFTMKLTPWPT